MNSICEEVKAERIRQDTKYEADRDLPPTIWHKLIIDELQEAYDGHANSTKAPHDYRTEMIQVTALCFAALESYDRQSKQIDLF